MSYAEKRMNCNIKVEILLPSAMIALGSGYLKIRAETKN